MSKIVATLDKEDATEIEIVNGRLGSLNSLVLTLADRKDIFDEKNYLYEKIIDDLKITQEKYNKWWSEIILKYNIEVPKSTRLSIDFKTFDVIVES